MYAASIADPDAFWAEHGKRVDWVQPYTRVFLVQHEGQALDAIERFGDPPCVLTFELVP
jgi:hypothetical protein